MAIRHSPVDVVLVGLGWTGSIMGMEMTDAGLQDTPTTANYPNVIDELAYSVRGKLYQDLTRETVAFRHNINGFAVPYRQHGSILLGTGVGGSGFHWSGLTWRAQASDLRLRSHYEERYGKPFIPQGMTIQDFGVSYEELEPYFARFEAVAGIAGKAGNLNGTVVRGATVLKHHAAASFHCQHARFAEQACAYKSKGSTVTAP